MRKLWMVMAPALIVSAVLTGCTVYTPALGMIYTEVYGPIEAGPRVGQKEGRACVESILGLVATGNASIKEAARNGEITTIESVDHYSRNILLFYAEFCTIVRGS